MMENTVTIVAVIIMGNEAEMTPISLAASIALKEDFSGTVEQTVRLSPI
jgi:hypothetical protein